MPNDMISGDMTPGQFLRDTALFLAIDDVLQSWCQEEFGKSLSVQVGVDEENPPGIDLYPLVVLVNCIQERGDARKPVFVLQLGCGCYNEEVSADGNLVIYEGMLQSADLANQVEQAVFRSKTGTFEIVGEDIPISFHPMHVTNTSVRCELVKSSRRPVR